MEPSVFDNNLVRFMVLIGATAGLVGMFVALSAWIGPKRTNPAKEEPFECGVIPKTDATGPFPIKYYLVAVLFIVFDIEVAFLYPWAVTFLDLGLTGYLAMVVFLAILGVGLYYEVSKRLLDWK